MNPYVEEFLGKYQEKINRRENHKVLMEMREVRRTFLCLLDFRDPSIFEFYFYSNISHFQPETRKISPIFFLKAKNIAFFNATNTGYFISGMRQKPPIFLSLFVVNKYG